MLYLATVQGTKIEGENIKKIKETLLINSETYADVEKQIYDNLESNDELVIKQIKHTDYAEVLYETTNNEIYFSVKLNYEDIESEKKKSMKILISTNDINKLVSFVDKTYNIPNSSYTIESISKTNISEL